MGQRFLYAFLHGLFSGPHHSKNGADLGKLLSQNGQQLFKADLNHPNAVPLTVSPALEYLNHWFQEKEREVKPAAVTGIDLEPSNGPVKLRLVGLSYGGYLAARYAQLHPDKVDSLVLLSPAFKLKFNFSNYVGEEVMQRMKENGQISMPTPVRPEAEPLNETENHLYQIPCPYSFFEGFSPHPDFPIVSCPTVILHGRRDRVIPLHTSHSYVEYIEHYHDEHGRQEDSRPPLTVHVLEEKHDLYSPASLAAIRKTVGEMWEITETKT